MTRLGSLRRNWERFGRRDHFWAILTDADKRPTGWDREQFFKGGDEEIAAVLERAERLGVSVSRRRALDFGCGVGRLTQAMAIHFERCDGVDISASMLRAARRYDQHPERCAYHLNAHPDLALFPDGSFTFAYSTLVLQHIAPRYSTAYIRELMRVLVPGGLLVFQLPSHRAAREPSADVARTPVSGRLPSVAFNARIAPEHSSMLLRAGEEVPIRVTVENASTHTWSALPDARGRHQINLANHWLDEDGALLQRDDARCPLPNDLPPGSRAELMLGVTAPAHDGIYGLELDLVQENVGWFAQRGSSAVRVRCQVTGGFSSPHPRRPSQTSAVAEEPERPFRERHPRTFRLLRVTGLRDIYWSWRRALDLIKFRRDRVIIGLRQRVYEPLIPPLVNWWLGRPFAPRMDMHCVARSEVRAILTANGGRAIDVEECLTPGGFQSCRYWVVKD